MAKVLKTLLIGGSSASTESPAAGKSWEIVDLYYHNSSGEFEWNSPEFQEHVVDELGEWPTFKNSVRRNVPARPGALIEENLTLTVAANTISSNGLQILVWEYDDGV